VKKRNEEEKLTGEKWRRLIQNLSMRKVKRWKTLMGV